MFELFCRLSHVRASLLRITSLELLRTLMLCLVQLSNWRVKLGHICWKAFFLVRKLVYAILIVNLKYMKCFFSHEMKCFLQCRRQIFLLELFCKVSHLRASLLRITSLELLRTLNLCLVQLSKWTERKATYAEKLLSHWEWWKSMQTFFVTLVACFVLFRVDCHHVEVHSRFMKSVNLCDLSPILLIVFVLLKMYEISKQDTSKCAPTIQMWIVLTTWW